MPQNSFQPEQLLAFAAHAEVHSSHPIAQSIVAAYGKPIEATSVTNYQEIAAHGVSANVTGKTVAIGNDRLLHYLNVDHPACIEEGTIAHIVVDGRYAGHLVIADELKEDSADAVAELHSLGVREVRMLTGDSDEVAAKVAATLGLDGYSASLLPEDKVTEVEALMERTRGNVAFVGDGINDAPVLTRADIGVAMGGLGSDAAIEVADIVIMSDHPSKMAAAVRHARRTRRIIWENVYLSLGIKGVILILGAIGLASMWAAIVADVGVALLAIGNSTRALRIK